MKKTVIVLLVLQLIAIAAGAQQNTCSDPSAHPEQCTGSQVFNFYRDAALERAGIDTNAAATAAIAKATTDEVKNSNRATTPPDPFATRIHNSYQDFLNLFSFAINKVDESSDGQALTVRFNPIREGSQVLGFTLTAAKPVVSEVVKNALPETGRSDFVTKLEGQLNDTDDLTAAGSYALQTANCDMSRPSTSRCYGRAPSSYIDFFSRGVTPLFAAAPDETEKKRQQLKQFIGHAFSETVVQNAIKNNIDILGLKVNEATNQVDLLMRLRQFGEAEAQQTIANRAFFSKQNLDVISTLIDNQPQFTVTGSYRTPGKFGGPKQTALTGELQFGSENVNTLRAECHLMSDACIQDVVKKRLTNGVSSSKWVVAASYTRNDNYKLSDLGLKGGNPSPFSAIDQRSSSEIIVKGQGGQQLTAGGPKAIRADFAVEGHRVEKDRVRNTNRWVAKATLTLPAGDNISIPVTVTWANKPEFLGDQRQTFGAHLGLSYRIPMLNK
jgi:hypothetical protein